MMDKQQTIRRMIEKECQRDGLEELCEYWGVTCDDFYAFLDDACRAQKVSNADHIRSMSDEELATEITKNPPIPCRMCESYNHKLGHCDARRDFVCVTAYAEALALDWLKQPVKEEHHETD